MQAEKKTGKNKGLTFIELVFVLALLVIWDIIREKSLAHVLSLGLISIPLIMRALMIK